MIYIDVITLFPDMFKVVTEQGVTRRAFKQSEQDSQETQKNAGSNLVKQVSFKAWQLRDFTNDKHKTVDDRPYGGGPGMVMLAKPLADAIESAKVRQQAGGVSFSEIIYLSPQGEVLTDSMVADFVGQTSTANLENQQTQQQNRGLILLCGRYEGIDERLLERMVDRQISIGDFVLSGGELPAMVLIDALVRRLPGVLNDSQSAVEESFATGLLDWPHYTRPELWQDAAVPDVLLSGDHAVIATWRLKQAMRRTQQHRPDLWLKYLQQPLSKLQKKLIAEIQVEQE